MFDIGWSEMMIIAAVAIIVVGPKDLPGMLRTIGKFTGTMQRMAGDFRRQFNDAMREAELDEVQKSVSSLTKAGTNPIGAAVSSVKDSISDTIKDVDDSGKASDAVEAKKPETPAPAAKKTAAKKATKPASSAPARKSAPAKPKAAARPAKSAKDEPSAKAKATTTA